MQTKTHKINFKNISEDGYFEGYASVFNIKDHQGDIILPGAFLNSLKKQNSTENIKMLWQHNVEKPIGVWEHVVEDGFGLFVKGRLLLDIKKAKEAYTLLKSGIIDGLSIGFQPTQSYFDKTKNATCITSIELLEISLVTFAANPKAKITCVKQKSYIEQKLKEFKLNLDKLNDSFSLKSNILNQLLNTY
jgi:HK97 family phage prohead protease